MDDVLEIPGYRGRALGHALRYHWPEYLMEALLLALLFLALCCINAGVESPASPIRPALADPLLRRVVRGLAIGAVAIALVYSPWGQQSGAHLNPALTLTYFRLQKVWFWDACCYVLAQFLGGLAGALLATLALQRLLPTSPASYAATVPGMWGTGIAFLAESLIAFLLMLVVLTVSNTQRLARATGLCSGALVASYIILESPLSGASLNPARTLAAALLAQLWVALWVYFLAPPLGMLCAAQLYLWLKGDQGVICAKLHHHNEKRCIFRCGYRARARELVSAPTHV